MVWHRGVKVMFKVMKMFKGDHPKKLSTKEASLGERLFTTRVMRNVNRSQLAALGSSHIDVRVSASPTK
jgi:hypothetical protein